MPWFISDLRLTLDDPGSEGGSGGGGEPQAPPIDEAPPRNPRAAIYEKMEADSVAAAEPVATPPVEEPVQKAEAPPAPAERPPDSGQPPKQEGKPPAPEEIAAKRVADAQAALTRKSQEYAKAQARIQELQEKLSLVDEHIDWEKARAYKKELAEKKQDEPVLHREVQTLVQKELDARDEAARAAREQNEALAERSRRVDALLAKHPHLKTHMESGELNGVGDRLYLDHPEKTWEEIGDMAAEFFKQREEAIRKKITQELTTRREMIAAGGMPRAAGDMPGDSPGPAEVDTSLGAELAGRRAALSRQRTLI